jgi:short-subunit dehydrogenase
MDVNYFGPVELMRAVLPHMRQQGRGKIINVSSVSGMLAMPTMASYTASKYALEGISEALWYEVKPLGINVSLIQPGFIKSESFKNVYYTKASRFAEAKGADEPYGDYYANMTPFITRLMNMSVTRPSSIAKLVLKVIRTENPPLWIPATLDAFIFYYLRRFVPRRILLTILFWGLPKVRKWGRKYTNKRKRF